MKAAQQPEKTPDVELRAQVGMESVAATALQLPTVAPAFGAPAVATPSPSQNLRRHWFRGLLRVSLLLSFDLGVFFVLLISFRSVRAGAVLGDRVGAILTALFPPSFVVGFELGPALIFATVLVGAYGAGNARWDPSRLFSASFLAALFTLYRDLWSAQAGLAVIQILAITLVFGSALSIARSTLAARLARRRETSSPVRVVSITDGVEMDQTHLDHVGSTESINIIATLTATAEDPVARPLSELIRTRQADTVLVSNNVSSKVLADVMDVALTHGCRLIASTRLPRTDGTAPRSVIFGGIPMTELTAPSLKMSQLFLKRCLDLTCSVAGIIVLSPVMALTALWIKLDSSGAVLFRQQRLGQAGARFDCFKFRTMHPNAEARLRSDKELYQLYLNSDYKLPTESDPRITRAGRILRRTSLDELPQLLNVLAGHISLVGPRPIVPQEIEHYGEVAPLFLSVKPGLTGLWAVTGRSEVHYPDRAAIELDYVRDWSVQNDLRILFKTLAVVFRQSGAA